MNCAYHSDRPVEGICSTCGRPICGECQVDLNGTIHCKSCLDKRMQSTGREVNGPVRFLLSIMPGIGHLYLGLPNRGLQFLLGTVLSAFVLDLLVPRSPLPGFLVAAAIFFSIFDAREAHLRMQQGLEVPDKGFVDVKQIQLQWNPRYVGYALIGVGVLVLYNTTVSDLLRLLFPSNYRLMESVIRGLTLGGVAIGAGVWMLMRGGDAQPAAKAVQPPAVPAQPPAQPPAQADRAPDDAQ